MQPTLHICLPGEGQRLSALGIEIEHKVSSEATDNKWSLLQYTAPPNFDGPPPHYHKILQETFFVLEGTLTLVAGNETVEATAGTVVVVPPFMVHKFSNKTNQPVKFLLLMNPGGFENYFGELVELRKSEPVWPPANPQNLQALLQRFDTFSPGQ